MDETTQGGSQLAATETPATPAKKSRKAKVKKVATKKVKAKKANGGVPRKSVANFIRAQLKSGKEPAAIVTAAKKAFPKKAPTVGYVNWIKEHAPKVSTAKAA